MQQTLRDEVFRAAGRAQVREAVGRVYADVQARIDERKPVCVVSGRCCRFEEFGHRLFVTTMELATFVGQWSVAGGQWSGKKQPGLPVISESRPPLTTDHRPLTTFPAWNGTGCPFQVGKLCGVHAIRPFGCRMFFCDATSTQWQNETYEHVHVELKRLHVRLNVPYFYVEWRQALEMLRLAKPSASPAAALSAVGDSF